MNRIRRSQQSQSIEDIVFDAVIVGGGINGASIYHELCRAGLRVLLIDKGDFAGATSQASAMMIWGGLLHLRHLHVATVRRLSHSRDYLIRHVAGEVQAQTYRYLPRRDAGRSLLLARAALMSYWLFGVGRHRPHLQRHFAEMAFLDSSKFNACIEYEEGIVEVSDARFVLNWVLAYQSDEQLAFNYCALDRGRFDAAQRLWRLEVADLILDKQLAVSARVVINAAGTWTDGLNRLFAINTPYRHAFGKGVFIAYRRDERHKLPLMIETRDYQGCMSLTPWGPVSLWGPTETRVKNLEQGFQPEAEDVRYLLAQLNSHLARPVTPSDVISIRCGVRPLVVRRAISDAANIYKLPRKYVIHPDRDRPWISIYGGKLTSCAQVAGAVSSHLTRRATVRRHADTSALADGAYDRARRQIPLADHFMSSASGAERSSFPGLSESFPSARWCSQNEMCWSLDDYLRRRTNIAQWIPRGGLGAQNENLAQLHTIAEAIYAKESEARAAVSDYSLKIEREFDQVMAKCG
ncbi:MAG: glycerol-3-phosphate dehydrogenase [Acidobacteriota bacterium]|jgi:glycerol-3-phosphate dehydrogenase|nr:glycerol-3-phosphate dehydrogenase [Acidobacteriota bacterium]